MVRRIGRWLALLVLILGFLPAQRAVADSPLPPVNTFLGVGPAAVNPVTNTIYVLAPDDDGVVIVNGNTREALPVCIDPFLDCSGGNVIPLGIGVNTTTNRAYAIAVDTNSSVSAFSVIDGYGAAWVPFSTAALGYFPVAVAVDSVRNRAYALSAFVGDGALEIIDGNNAVSSVPLNDVFFVGPGASIGAVVVHPGTGVVYVTNNFGNTVTTWNGTVTSTIPVGFNPVSMAIDPVANRLVTANIGDGTAARVDLATTTVQTFTITLNSPTAMTAAVNPRTGDAFITSDIDNTVTAIRPNGTLVPIVVGAQPLAVAVNSATNRIYVANTSDDTVSVIDGATLSVIATIPTIAGPGSLAINPVTNMIYVGGSCGCSAQELGVIDGRQLTSNIISGSVDAASIALNPMTGDAAVANANASFTSLVNAATGITSTVPTFSGQQTVAYNPVTNRAYVGGNDIVRIGPNGNASAGTPGPISASVFNPVTNRYYGLSASTNQLIEVDGTTMARTPVTVPATPSCVAIDESTNRIFVNATTSQSVTIVNGATRATTTVSIGQNVTCLVFDPFRNRIVAITTGTDLVFINPDTQAVTTRPLGATFSRIAINPVNGIIALVDTATGTVALIDGSNLPIAPPVTAPVQTIAFDPATNRLYTGEPVGAVAYDARSGAPVYTTTLPSPATAFAFDPVRRTALAGRNGGSVSNLAPVSVLKDSQTSLPITTTIVPLPGNRTTSTSPAFTLNVTSGALPATRVAFQLDTVMGPWQSAPLAGGTAVVALPNLRHGLHTLYAYAVDGEDSTSTAITPNAGPSTGAIAAYAFMVTPAVAATAAPSSLTYAAQIVGTTSVAQTFTLSNTGQSYIAISAVAASGDFQSTSNCPATPLVLTVGASCVISTTFTPTATGARSGAITVTTPDGTLQSIPLSGNGILGGPASITPSGGNQSVTSGSAFAPLSATVRDSANNLLPGVTITFTTPVSATFPGGTTQAVTVTNASGVATAPTLTAAATVGSFSVSATAGPGLVASYPLTITQPVIVTTPFTAPPGGTITITVPTASGNATIVLTNVSGGGTVVTTIGTPLTTPPPGGIRFLNLNLDVQVLTATYGTATICLPYTLADAALIAPSTMSLFHLENGLWIDVTTRRDTANRVICGTVTSLSPFVIGGPPLSGGTGRIVHVPMGQVGASQGLTRR